jgi:hypothetical protein
LQVTCWGPAFDEAAQTNGAPFWRRIADLALRLATQQQRASELIEAGRAREASLMLQVDAVYAPISACLLRFIRTILMCMHYPDAQILGTAAMLTRPSYAS